MCEFRLEFLSYLKQKKRLTKFKRKIRLIWVVEHNVPTFQKLQDYEIYLELLLTNLNIQQKYILPSTRVQNYHKVSEIQFSFLKFLLVERANT